MRVARCDANAVRVQSPKINGDGMRMGIVRRNVDAVRVHSAGAYRYWVIVLMLCGSNVSMRLRLRSRMRMAGAFRRSNIDLAARPIYVEKCRALSQVYPQCCITARIVL